jgi:hypothetical protein
MKSIVYDLLSDDDALHALGFVKERWFDNSSQIDVSVKPFAVLSWGASFGESRAMQGRTLEVYLHDDRGSYMTITDGLNRISDLMEDAADINANGHRVTEANWIGCSGDLSDLDYKTNMRYVTFRVAGH